MNAADAPVTYQQWALPLASAQTVVPASSVVAAEAETEAAAAAR